MEGQALCAKVAAQDPKRADRMWNTVTDAQGHETIDPQARAKACEICSRCPVRLDCISRALVGGWKDDSIIGGIDYQRRKALSRVIAMDRGLDCFGSIVFCGFGQVVFSGLGVGHADHSRAVPW